MAGQEFGIRVEDLGPFIKALRRADPQLPREITKRNKRIAQDIATAARSNTSWLASSEVRSSVRASATSTSASILVGRPGIGETFGHVFGGQARPTTMQFRPHRGTTGYEPYESLREQTREPRLSNALFEGVEDVLEEAYPDG